jgi:hypothetical protein
MDAAPVLRTELNLPVVLDWEEGKGDAGLVERRVCVGIPEVSTVVVRVNIGEPIPGGSLWGG